MKLASKERVGSSNKRKYDTPETPYRRLMESDRTPEEVKEETESIYLSLNPAQLKRSIDAKLAELYKAYEEKKRARKD